MSAQKALDDLADAARQFIESDFDPDAFMAWRKRACDCVVMLLGPGHPHAQFFQALVAREARTSLLAMAGIPDTPERRFTPRAVPTRHMVSKPSTSCAGQKAKD